MLILDIGLPGVDGWELARQIRSSGNCPGAVFIAVTGFGPDFLHERARDESFDHCLVKPVDFVALSSILTSLATAEPTQQGHLTEVD